MELEYHTAGPGHTVGQGTLAVKEEPQSLVAFILWLLKDTKEEGGNPSLLK